MPKKSPQSMPSVRPVQQIAEPIAQSMGIAISRIQYDRENGAIFLRIYIDCGQGVDLHICERFHRALIPFMDPIEFDYMEVCSLGADRPLQSTEDRQAAIGKRVEVRLFQKVNGSKVFIGELTTQDADSITILCEGALLSFPIRQVALLRADIQDL